MKNKEKVIGQDKLLNEITRIICINRKRLFSII